MNVTIMQDPSSKAAALVAQPYSLDAILPMDLIREHTKTDDVPSVGDAVLNVYRKAALSAAQKYTGLLLQERKIVFEDVWTPVGTAPMRSAADMWFNHTAEYPFAEGTIYYYGLKNQAPQIVPVRKGTNVARLPRDHDQFGLGCCNPCGSPATARIQYVAGFGCEDDIPAEIILGCLKYIMHAVQNLGDSVITSQASGGKGDSNLAVADANNPALASGAIEIWRTVNNGAI